MYAISPHRGHIAVLILIVIIAAPILLWVKEVQRRHVYEHIQTMDLSRIALLRYVQLHCQCSEEAAYQRIATFVKNHVLPEDRLYIESMARHDRQGLLTYAQRILVQNPDEIDNI